MWVFENSLYFLLNLSVNLNLKREGRGEGGRKGQTKNSDLTPGPSILSSGGNHGSLGTRFHKFRERDKYQQPD